MVNGVDVWTCTIQTFYALVWHAWFQQKSLPIRTIFPKFGHIHTLSLIHPHFVKPLPSLFNRCKHAFPSPLSHTLLLKPSPHFPLSIVLNPADMLLVTASFKLWSGALLRVIAAEFLLFPVSY